MKNRFAKVSTVESLEKVRNLKYLSLLYCYKILKIVLIDFNCYLLLVDITLRLQGFKF